MFVDHVFSVPLSHEEPDGARIEVYAREVRTRPDRPWLLYLNGGPGFPAPRVHGDEGWLRRALADYRVLLLDQRGTGRSTPLDRHTLPRLGPHLRHFRADSIVRDAELIRRSLLGDEPWSVLGQSFGGYCTVTYLSLAPEGLREALITGRPARPRSRRRRGLPAAVPGRGRQDRGALHAVPRRLRPGRAGRAAPGGARGAARGDVCAERRDELVGSTHPRRVPVAAAIYDEDMYIARDLSLSTAASIRGLRPWLTADHGHDGLRVSNGAVLDHLLKLLG